MFNFYGYLKDRPSNNPITQEEKDIASGIKPLTTSKLAEYSKAHQFRSETIEKSFARQ